MNGGVKSYELVGGDDGGCGPLASRGAMKGCQKWMGSSLPASEFGRGPSGRCVRPGRRYGT